jgi:hypothetical protein
MATDGATMEDIKDEMPQGDRNNDQQEGAARLQTLAKDKAAVVDAKGVIMGRLLKSGMKARNHSRTPCKTVRQMTEKHSSGRVNGISGGSGRRQHKWVGSSSEAMGNMGGGSRGYKGALKRGQE